jgi:hypothetical protein
LRTGEIIETLKQKGDPLKTAREIDHLFYFKTIGGRQAIF